MMHIAYLTALTIQPVFSFAAALWWGCYHSFSTSVAVTVRCMLASPIIISVMRIGKALVSFYYMHALLTGMKCHEILHNSQPSLPGGATNVHGFFLTRSFTCSQTNWRQCGGCSHTACYTTQLATLS